MKPLKITWSLATPMVMANDNPLHLDGLIAWAAVEFAKRDPANSDPWAAQHQLGHVLGHIPRAGPEGETLWQASILSVKADIGVPLHWLLQVRRNDPDHWFSGLREHEFEDPRTGAEGMVSFLNPGRTQKAEAGSGEYRAFMMFECLRTVSEVTAWCIGDPHEVERHLGLIRNLGKQGRNNAGRVASYTITEDAEAAVRWRLRTLPATRPDLCAPGVSYAKGVSRLCVPYWQRHHLAETLVPLEA